MIVIPVDRALHATPRPARPPDREYLTRGDLYPFNRKRENARRLRQRARDEAKAARKAAQ